MLAIILTGFYFGVCFYFGWAAATWFFNWLDDRHIRAYCKQALKDLEIERIEFEKQKTLWDQENYVFGQAGEDIKSGELVTIGAADGLIRKSRNEN